MEDFKPPTHRICSSQGEVICSSQIFLKKCLQRWSKSPGAGGSSWNSHLRQPISDLMRWLVYVNDHKRIGGISCAIRPPPHPVEDATCFGFCVWMVVCSTVPISTSSTSVSRLLPQKNNEEPPPNPPPSILSPQLTPVTPTPRHPTLKTPPAQ